MLKYKKSDNLNIILELEESLVNPSVSFKLYDLRGNEVYSGTGNYDSENNFVLCPIDFSKLNESIYEIQIKVMQGNETKTYWNWIEVEE